MAEEIKDNGNGEESKELAMIIKFGATGMIVTFPFLDDKFLTYGFLKMAEKTLDLFYTKSERPKILSASQMPKLRIN